MKKSLSPTSIYILDQHIQKVDISMFISPLILLGVYLYENQDSRCYNSHIC